MTELLLDFIWPSKHGIHMKSFLMQQKSNIVLITMLIKIAGIVANRYLQDKSAQI